LDYQQVNEYFFYTYCPLSIFKRRKNNRNNVVNGADTFKFLAKHILFFKELYRF